MGNADFSHILCGVDGSDAACRAARVAARLAKAFDAQLTFVTVAKNAVNSPELDAYRRTEQLDLATPVPVVKQEADACLEIAVELAREVGIENANRVVRTGAVADAILSLGSELSADALVLGHHQRSRLGRAIVSSVSSKVADHGPMKVLLVP
ncbi:universal stress protein [Jannaschia seohaensis]|uniref:universal stress protein n=1 Tax=Jannaschia seohaensis TaxID=475081 RepID=UPI000D6D5449|nr:universal stress protein [Jannaschia seohaensis]